MTQTMKAVLLSTAIFPGAAHFYLKKYISGMVFSLIASVCSYFIIINFAARIMTVFEKIRTGKIAPDFLLMMQLILKQPVDPETKLSPYIWPVLIICWLLAILDSYRIAKKKQSVY